MLDEYERLQVENNLKSLISVSSGFNGGEEVKDMVEKWQKRINKGFEIIEKKDLYSSSEDLEKYDNFLRAFGI